MGETEKMLKEESALGSLAKVNTNALNTMETILTQTQLELPKNWSKLHLDLDAACDIYEQLKSKANNEHFTQVDPFKIYTVLCVLNGALKKYSSGSIQAIFSFKLSIKELASIVNCGRYGAAQAKDLKKQLRLISELLSYDEEPILLYKANNKASPTIVLSPAFFSYCKKYLNCKKHDFLRLSAKCCSCLFKLNRKPKAFVCMLEQIFQDSKALLEQSSEGKAFNRDAITEKRIFRLFSPKAPHSVKEIMENGHSLLKKVLGENYHSLLKGFAMQMIDDCDKAKFSIIKKTKNETYLKKSKRAVAQTDVINRVVNIPPVAVSNDLSYHIA